MSFPHPEFQSITIYFFQNPNSISSDYFNPPKKEKKIYTQEFQETLKLGFQGV